MTLREAREAAGLSLVAAGKAAGLSYASLSCWETGKQPVSDGHLARLAAVYGIPVESLSPEPPPLELSTRRLGALAARMVPNAAELACLVREQDREGIGRFFATVTRQEIPVEVQALLIDLAAMVPMDRGTVDLLAWVDFDEFGRPLDGAGREADAA